MSACFAEAFTMLVKSTPHFAHSSLEPRDKTSSCVVLIHLSNMCTHKKDTPGDGFEPPLEEPESSVLPLDDPGISFSINNLYYSLIWFALPKKCKRPKSSV